VGRAGGCHRQPFGAAVYDTLAARHLGLKPIGPSVLLTTHAPPADPELGLQDAAAIGSALGSRFAMISLPERTAAEIAGLTRRYVASFHRVIVISDLFNVASLEVTTVDVGGFLGVEFRHRLLFRTPRFIKRSIDIVASAAGLALLLPFFLIVAALIRLTSTGPVFYSQSRIGLRGERFRAWKFRSMRQNADHLLESFLHSNPDLRREWENERKLKRDPRHADRSIIANHESGRVASVVERPQGRDEHHRSADWIPRLKYGHQYDMYKRVRPGINAVANLRPQQHDLR
jgi:hypothetical protein